MKPRKISRAKFKRQRGCAGVLSTGQSEAPRPASAAPDALKPDAALLCKLGSIAVHCDEYWGPLGHPFDREAAQQLLRDADVKRWLAEMVRLALLPKKRH
jgi:hypothetical protein